VRRLITFLQRNFSRARVAGLIAVIGFVGLFLAIYAIQRDLTLFPEWFFLPWILGFSALIVLGAVIWRSRNWPDLRFAKLNRRLARLAAVTLAIIFFGALVFDFLSPPTRGVMGLLSVNFMILFPFQLASLFFLPFVVLWHFLSSRIYRRELHEAELTAMVQEFLSRMLQRGEYRLPDGVFRTLWLSVENGERLQVVALVTNKRLLARTAGAASVRNVELECSFIAFPKEQEDFGANGMLRFDHQGSSFQISGEPDDVARLHKKILEAIYGAHRTGNEYA
jgi:hypothetical protein